jgi:undecaprenyl-diphosphatase
VASRREGYHLAIMTVDTERGRLAELLAVAGAGALFAVLLVLVRYRWAPLESLDHGLAARGNSLVAHRPDVLMVLRAVTRLGSSMVLWWAIGVAAAVLAIRHRYRLAGYLLVSGAGSLILDPTLKFAVGRLRPVVADPVAHGTGNSFPSGHALGSIVCYGALVLVFLPALPRRARTGFIAGAGLLVLGIGVSRILLGVHYLSDVVGAWALGVAWLGLTSFALELSRHASGQRVSRPLAEGLAPEAAADLKPADPVRGRSGAGRAAAAVLVAWVMVFGAVVGLGELIIRYGGKNLLGDRAIPHALAAHRTATGDAVSLYLSRAGDTHAILAIGIVAGAIAIATIRRWRPVVFLIVLMVGELTLFLASAAIVGRARPDVPQLDAHLPTSSYPSGHVAATICLYAGITLLLVPRSRARWAWLILVPAILVPLLVAGARMYRGMHHPTDILGSLVLAAAWIPLVWLAVQPNRDLQEPAPTAPAPPAVRPATRLAPVTGAPRRRG